MHGGVGVGGGVMGLNCGLWILWARLAGDAITYFLASTPFAGLLQWQLQLDLCIRVGIALCHTYVHMV